VKILSKVVDEVFESHPKIVEEARTIKSARYYLTDLILKELDNVSKVDLEAVFSIVKEKLERKMNLKC
jgi:Asp-tRNA(Asn)/Glu-tRNA(Gln) amidotransferase B subunit